MRLPAVVGAERTVPLLDGRWVPYVNLDNAASTPPLQEVQAKVEELLPWYASIHRGFGYKSRLCTEVYEEARGLLAEFVGAADPGRVVVFTKHTTEAINKAAQRIPFRPGDVVLTTMLEHHANLLPWRGRAEVVHLPNLPDGGLDLDAFTAALERYAGRVRLVAVTGGSNVTGYLPPVHDLAELAHAAGAEILIDAAQLAPNRRIDMRACDDPRRLDWLAFSAHKLYAPYGAGVLVGPRQTLREGLPELRGGGAVRRVTLEAEDWREPPEREEAGTPNLVGAVALAVAARTIGELQREGLEEHERELTRYALDRLGRVRGLRLFGPPAPHGPADDRLGVFSFTLQDIPSALVAAVLSFEYGIGVREGSFCAHPYVARLLGLDPESVDWNVQPGMVRASLGLYNTQEDVDALVSALQEVAAGKHGDRYHFDPRSGDFVPEGGAVIDDYRGVFSLARG